MSPQTRVVALCFLATLVAYVERSGFNVAFTAAAATAGLSQSQKGTVLSAFYWGYALTQIPGGYAASRVGGGKMLVGSMVALVLASLATPLGDEDMSLTRVAAARVAVGVVQGVVFPSVHTLLAEWIAPRARSRCVSVAMSGMYLGSATSMMLAPAIVEQSGAKGQLRTHAVCCLAWLLLFALLFPHSAHPPGDAKKGLPLVTSNGDSPTTKPQKRQAPVIPWGGMLRCSAVWAIITNNFGYHYLVYVLVSWQPTYFEQALGVRLAGNKLAMAAPYFVMTACTTIGGLLSDYLIARGHSVVRARKTVNTGGFAVAAMALCVVPTATDATAAGLWIAVSLGAAAIGRGGFAVNHMDIAPRHAGVLMGLSNSAGTLAGVVGVRLTGSLLEWSGGAWAPVFQTAAAICVGSLLVFLRFAKGDKLFG